ncbi:MULTISPECIES: hypothetical protein [Hyphomicrobiales]|jgi:hypothetical protein|uniref:Uncharacterized protein n=2 Tax=Prosthecodimorpha TaxID=2981530 RepID=A0A0N8GEP8_9HYPH|nr:MULTISPECIES: hypothetical protein [Hyphomicrobiales]KPL52121.1 hypothetical protein ABB55_07680 [Prosthecomicrobium hirschii]MBT9288732.1 hypothetical protein [Prosthecodimorpha staleyi]MCW1843496.1 hypothetical protein [Prosthecomicrobium hirschii]TPQ48656.1 hypothetical protein C2U72_22530 [Prosthecomicrobium hirschii]
MGIDSIQRSSTVPIPEPVSDRTTRDPLPVDSKLQIDKSNDKRLQPSNDAKTDSFEDYLNDKSVLNLEKNKESSKFDPVAELSKNGVYYDPGKNTPI